MEQLLLKKIRSFLGMVNYYQHFIPNYSAIAKPLFNLLKGQKARVENLRKLDHVHQNRKLKPSKWTQVQDQAVEKLKVVLAHPDFDLGESCESNIQQNKDHLTVPNADVSALLNSYVEWNIGARA